MSVCCVDIRPYRAPILCFTQEILCIPTQREINKIAGVFQMGRIGYNGDAIYSRAHAVFWIKVGDIHPVCDGVLGYVLQRHADQVSSVCDKTHNIAESLQTLAVQVTGELLSVLFAI